MAGPGTTAVVSARSFALTNWRPSNFWPRTAGGASSATARRSAPADERNESIQLITIAARRGNAARSVPGNALSALRYPVILIRRSTEKDANS